MLRTNAWHILMIVIIIIKWRKWKNSIIWIWLEVRRLSIQNFLSILISYSGASEKRTKKPKEHHLSRLGSFPLCPPGAAAFPRKRVGCLVATRPSPGNRVHTHSGSGPVSSTWLRKLLARPPRPTCLSHRCRLQDHHRPRPRPPPQSPSRPWSRRRAYLAPHAARTRCPSPCFMGRWTQKIRFWPPLRRRYRSC